MVKSTFEWRMDFENTPKSYLIKTLPFQRSACGKYVKCRIDKHFDPQRHWMSYKLFHITPSSDNLDILRTHIQ